MSSRPAYHVRPNKHIDRSLFIEALSKLNFDFNGYRYVGFGSYSFDDFKAMHCKIGINKMISLESDSAVVERAKFNSPYECIEIKYGTSSDYLEELIDYEANQIIWFDYTSPQELFSQFSDAIELVTQAKPNDVLRFTFNANPNTLASKDSKMKDDSELYEARLEKLKKRLEEYCDPRVKAEDLTQEGYPRVLRRSLRYSIERIVNLPNQYDERVIIPLFSTTYKDTHQMLTVTLLVSTEDEKSNIENKFQQWQIACLDWEAEEKISIPYLTEQEFFATTKLIPNKKNAEEELREKFPGIYTEAQEAISFVKHYKSYPHFHNVEF